MADTVEATASDIARIADVKASAVSNWRRRHDDFPAPVAGTARHPRFDLAAVTTWLVRHGKIKTLPVDEQVWQAFASACKSASTIDTLAFIGTFLLHLHQNPQLAVPTDRDGLHRLLADAQRNLTFGQGAALTGLIGTVAHVAPGARHTALLRAATDATRVLGAKATFADMCTRALGPADGLPTEIAHFMLDLTAPKGRILRDPACATGSLLVAATQRGYRRLEGQDDHPSRLQLAAVRLAFEHDMSAVDLHHGDALQQAAFQPGSATTVVSAPPFGDRNWGKHELRHDPRWEYGIPAQIDAGFAWLQHGLHEVRPGGTVIMMLPPTAASRPASSAIRRELVRRGTVRAVFTLPVGSAAHHAVPLQVWVLERPKSASPNPQPILLVDLHTDRLQTESAPSDAGDNPLGLAVHCWRAFRQRPAEFAGIPGIATAVTADDILHEDADLTPRRHLLSSQSAPTTAQLTAEREQFLAMARDLTIACPNMPVHRSKSQGTAADVPLGELAQAGLLILWRPPRSRPINENAPEIAAPLLTYHDFVADRPPSRSAETPAESVHQITIRPDDVVLTTALSAERRLHARVATSAHAGAQPGPNLCLIRTDPKLLDPWYLAGFLSSPEGHLRALRIATTIGDRSRFNPDRLPVPLPPLHEQRELGQVFRALTDFLSRLESLTNYGNYIAERIATNAINTTLESSAPEQAIAEDELLQGSQI